MPPLRRSAGVIAALVLASVACKRGTTPTAPTASAAPVVASAPPNANANPFVRSFPIETATITYEKKDGSLRDVFHVKGGRVRSQTTGGLFAGDTFSVLDGDVELRVIPKEKTVRRFRTPEAHLFAAYRALAPEQQARVVRSIGVVGADLPWYVERSPTRIGERDFQGLHASCYRMTSRVLGDDAERCYWRGILVFMKEKNPIDDRVMEGIVTKVALNTPVDDALFAIPAAFAQVDEDEQIGATMHDVYAKLVERMTSERFAREHLDRYAPSP